MQLNEISEEVCETCGAPPTQETKINRHCNRHWNESRTFACGRKVRFSPNLLRIEVDSECPNHPEEKSRRTMHKRWKEGLLNHIKRSKTSEDFKAKALRALECL